MSTTIGQILVNEVLPPAYRDYNRTIGKKELESILEGIIETNPDQYKDISSKLVRIGNSGSYFGGTTLTLNSIKPTFDRNIVFSYVKKQEDRILNSKDISEKDKENLIADLHDRAYSQMKSMTYDSAVRAKNMFAMQVKSKARGDENQLSAMISTPGIYSDSTGRQIPMFISHSYAEGLTPAELWAGTHGARLGVVSTKQATAKAGALGKLLESAAVSQVVTEDDCGTPNGIPVKADDSDNLGCVLAMDVGGHHAGEVIDKTMLSDFAKQKISDIVVRSPITCSAHRGVCAHCAGIRESGKFPEIGYNLGLNASTAIAERIAQGSLNVKHSGKKASGASQYSGFDMLKDMATVPEHYPDRATISEIDGKVTKIEKAPQGGNFVFVNENKYYVPNGYEIFAKVGDQVEAGDQLADGVLNPAEVVKYKGIGEGRRYFVERFTKAYRDSNYKANRRNIEAVTRSLIDSVEVEDEDSEGQFLPGDITSYSSWSFGYKPRPNSVSGTPNQLIGKYLEQPVLHYTIGSRVTKKMSDELSKFKIQSIMANDAPPNVSPVMQSVVKTTGTDRDWMARLATTYLKDRLVEDAQRGSSSDLHGLNPYPGMAKGIEFGKYNESPAFQKQEFNY